MCNQCNDYRRIHTGKYVFGVFHNGKLQTVFKTEENATRAKNLMAGGNAMGNKYCSCTIVDDCLWDVYQIERRDVSWEG
jgi:hypothetical protein